MVLFTGPVLVSYYFPKLMEMLIQSLRIVPFEEIKEDDLLPNANLIEDMKITDKELDTNSYGSDFSAESFANQLIKSISIMPSYLEIDENSEHFIIENEPVSYLPVIEENIVENELEVIDGSEETMSNAAGADNEKITNANNGSEDLTLMQKMNVNLEQIQNFSTNLIENIWKHQREQLSSISLSITSQTKPKRNDSDSDFEMVYSDDIQTFSSDSSPTDVDTT